MADEPIDPLGEPATSRVLFVENFTVASGFVSGITETGGLHHRAVFLTLRGFQAVSRMKAETGECVISPEYARLLAQQLIEQADLADPPQEGVQN